MTVIWYAISRSEALRDRSRYTPSEQWEILNTHPFFTGVCPVCRYQFNTNNPPEVHYDCPECGWIDDSI